MLQVTQLHGHPTGIDLTFSSVGLRSFSLLPLSGTHSVELNLKQVY